MVKGNFVRFSGGPWDRQIMDAGSWPPPEEMQMGSLEGVLLGTYRRVRMSKLTDEQAALPHVARGAEYEWEERRVDDPRRSVDELHTLAARHQDYEDDPYITSVCLQAADDLSAALDERDRLRLIHGAQSTEAYRIFEERLQETEAECDRLRKELAILRAYARPEDIAAAERSLAPQETHRVDPS